MSTNSIDIVGILCSAADRASRRKNHGWGHVLDVVALGEVRLIVCAQIHIPAHPVVNS